MKDGQSDIYYMTGESRSTVENSPHLEAFRAKGYEVLVLTDPVDELWPERIGQFDGRPLRSVAMGQIDLDTEADKNSTQTERDQQGQDFAGLLTWLGATLQEEVKQVRLSSRLTTSPACLVGDDHDLLAETAHLLYGMALLAEGGELKDPSRFARMLADRLTHTL